MVSAAGSDPCKCFPANRFLALGLKLPFKLPASGIDRVKPAAVAAEIYDSVLDRRRRCHPHAGKQLPLLLAGCEIHCVQIAVRAPHKDHAISHRRRRNHLAIRVELPLDLVEPGDTLRLIDTGVGEVPAKHGGVLTEGGQTEHERGEQAIASRFHAG